MHVMHLEWVGEEMILRCLLSARFKPARPAWLSHRRVVGLYVYMYLKKILKNRNHTVLATYSGKYNYSKGDVALTSLHPSLAYALPRYRFAMAAVNASVNCILYYVRHLFRYLTCAIY